MDRILNYVSSHTFEFKIPSNTIEEVQQSIEEGDFFLYISFYVTIPH